MHSVTGRLLLQAAPLLSVPEQAASSAPAAAAKKSSRRVMLIGARYHARSRHR
jgi:hypothetical protein